MIQKILLWFYCLPLSAVLFLLLLGGGTFLILKAAFGHKKFWRDFSCIVLILWLLLALSATVFRSGGSAAEPVLIPFYSYWAALREGQRELLRSNFMNTALFFPAGLFAVELFPNSWPFRRKVLLTCLSVFLLSMGIEYFQYRFGLGLAEADDVIHNVLGAFLGSVLSLAGTTSQK